MHYLAWQIEIMEALSAFLRFYYETRWIPSGMRRFATSQFLWRNFTAGSSYIRSCIYILTLPATFIAGTVPIPIAKITLVPRQIGALASILLLLLAATICLLTLLLVLLLAAMLRGILLRTLRALAATPLRIISAAITRRRIFGIRLAREKSDNLPYETKSHVLNVTPIFAPRLLRSCRSSCGIESRKSAKCI